MYIQITEVPEVGESTTLSLVSDLIKFGHRYENYPRDFNWYLVNNVTFSGNNVYLTDYVGNIFSFENTNLIVSAT